MTLRGLLIAVAAGWVVFLAGWLLAPASTNHRRVRARALAQPIRWWRSWLLRAGSTLAGWPHVIDVLAGYGRTTVATTPGEIVWRAGTATMVRYAGSRRHRCPVLLVHAMVTRPWILDLTPATSVVRALVEDGFDVFLLDWGDATPKSASLGFDDYVRMLTDAEAYVLDASRAELLHLVGYCSGASLCMMRVAALPHEHVASVVNIAGPVDLSRNGGMTRIMANPFVRPVMVLDEAGLVPAEVVRASFQALRPAAIRTVARGLAVRRSKEIAPAYGGLARWVWEQRPIPGALFFDLVELFRTNSLARGTLEVLGARADLSAIRCPVLSIVAERDHIMPGPGWGRQVVSPSGHVSLLTGSAARTVLIPTLTEWLVREAAEA